MPGAKPAACDGNMLWFEGGQQDYCLLNRAIHRYAGARLDVAWAGAESVRLRNKLRIRQSICFNFFAPLPLDLALASRLLATCFFLLPSFSCPSRGYVL
jgi:hypothetical protein